MNAPRSPLVRERLAVLRPQLPTFERLEPYLRRIDQTRVYSNHGPLVHEFETRVSEHLGLPGALVTASSGTTALAAAILASAGRATPERPYALLPAFTFVATALAAEACGYQPYLADIDSGDWQLAPQRALTHPALDRMGVAIAVSPFGRPLAQAPWRSFRERTGIPVVIDGAACFDVLAQKRHNARTALGELPVALSFHATKSFATGEGGAVITSDQRLRDITAQTLNLGFWGSRECRTPALNGKMSEYHAAVGLAEHDGWVTKHAAAMRVARLYHRAALRTRLVGELFTAPAVSGCYVILAARDRDEAADVETHLQRAGIGSRYWYGAGLHRHSHFRGAARDPLPATDEMSSRLLGLPFAPDLTDADVDLIVTTVARSLKP